MSKFIVEADWLSEGDVDNAIFTKFNKRAKVKEYIEYDINHTGHSCPPISGYNYRDIDPKLTDSIYKTEISFAKKFLFFVREIWKMLKKGW